MTAIWTANRTWVDGEIVTAAMMNQYLRDNLDWLKGRPQVNASDFDGTVYSTTSSTFQDTGLSATLTTTGGRVMVVAWGSWLIDNSATNGVLTLYEDGVNVGNSTEGMQYLVAASNGRVPFAIAYITPTAPTAASHTWKLYLRSTNGVNTANIKQYQMWATEIGA
jgi:hypothetical protein